MGDLGKIRREYRDGSLRKENMPRLPMEQFHLWFEEALENELVEPNAMSVATLGVDGAPAIRTVLLKEYSQDGFVFFSNYKSSKGKAIDAFAEVALCFWWRNLERQVCVKGRVSKLSRDRSAEYFKKRPRGGQIAAWASKQGEVIPSRIVLEQRFDEFEKKFEDKPVSLPTHWGGYLVSPYWIEFWQGGANRLHDRLAYVFREGEWVLERYAP